MTFIDVMKRLLKHDKRSWADGFGLLACCWTIIGVLSVLSAGAQEEAAEAPAIQNEKALRYFEVLQRRPAPGYLFDRFYNAWLDSGTIDSLESFLASTVEADGSTENRLLLAFFYVKQGENVQALEQFRVALEKDPGSAEAWYQKSLVEQRTLDFDTALGDLTRALDAEPDKDLTREILQLQGRLHARNGDLANAKAAWTRLLEANAGDEALREDLIELQMNEGLYDEALATAEDLLASTTDPYLAVLRQMRIGDIHQRAGRKAEGLDAYGATLARVGNGTWIEKEIFAQIEQVFRREDDLAGLKTHLEKLLEEHPERIGLRRQLVDLLAELGEKEAATEQFSEILALTPGDRAVRETYVETLAKLDMPEEAVNQLELLIEQHPGDGELLVKLAQLQHSLENDEDARQTLARYVETSDKSEYVYLRTCRLLEEFGLLDAAEETFEDVLAEAPESEGVRDTYAAFLHRRGKTKEAVDAWRAIAEGGDRESVVRVARTLANRGELEAAHDLLRNRYEDFKADAVYLTQLCQLALQLRATDDALPWALRLVEIAENPLDLENAVSLAAKIADQNEAVDVLRERLKREAKRPQELCLLSELHERRGDSREAEAVLATIQDEAPELALAQLIGLHRQRHDFAAAAEAAVQLAESPGGRRTANVQKVVELFERASQHGKALEWIPEWKKLSPGSTLPWLAEARLLLDNGQGKAAVDTLRRANQQFDGNEEIRATLARIYGEEGQLADASRMYMQLYEEAQDVSSKLRWVRQLASTAELAGKSQALLEQFEERKRNNRTSIVPLLALAEIHEAENNYEGRRQSLLEAARIKPEDVDLLLEIARVEESELDFERALATLERALAIEDSHRVKTRIAKIHFNQGDHEAGFQVLRELAGSDPDPKNAEQLAQSIIGTGDWEYAVRFLGDLSTRFPDNYRLGYLHALALEENGEVEAATTAFADLLRNAKEMPADALPPTPAQSNSRRRYQEMFAEIAPKSVMPFLGMSMQTSSAYQHRRSQRSYTSFGGYTPQLTPVHLPENLQSLHDHVLVHLVTLGNQVEEAQRELAKVAIAERYPGIEDFIFDLSPNPMGNQQLALLLEEHPDNETLLALGIMQGFGRSPLDVATLTKAVERFEQPYPQLAFLAALSALQHPDRDGAKTLIQKAFDALDGISEPGYLVISAVVESLNVMDQGAALEISEEHRSTLMNKVVEWYDAVDSSDPYHASLFFTVAAALGNKDDLRPFVRFLDRTVTEAAENSNATPSPYINAMSRSNRQSLLKPVEFPPAMLESVPAEVVGILTNENYYGRRISFDPEQLAPAIEEAKSDMLKLLLHIRMKPESEATAEMIEQLLEAEEPDLDAFVLAASHAAVVEGETAKAVGLLERAKYLPMTRERRRELDASILSWTLETPEPDEATLAAGRDAALRLRRGLLMPQQRQELIGAMEQLGMSNEAERLEKKTMAALTPGSRSLGAFRSGSSRQPAPSRIEQLLGDGKKEQALKLLANDLQSLAFTGLSPQGVFNNQGYEDNWLNQLAGFGLTEDLLAHVDPGESKSYRQRANWAFACELLGKAEEAKAIYREILDSRPNDDGVRLRLLSLYLTEEPETASALMDELSAASFQTFVNQMHNVTHNDETPFEERMKLVEMVAEIGVNREKEADVKGPASVANWLPNLTDQVQNIAHAEGVSFGQLYQAHDADSSNRHLSASQQATVQKLRQQRRETHDKLCRMMLEIPSTTREGFRRLSGLLAHDGHDEQALFELAKQALLDYEPPTLAALGNLSSYGGSNQDTLPMWSPEHFVARHAFRHNDSDQLEGILEALEQADRGRTGKLLAAELRDARELFFCPEEDFETVAKKHLQAGRGRGYTQNNELLLIFDAWDQRALKKDPAPFFLELVEETKQQNWSNATQHEILRQLALRKLEQGDEALHRFFADLTDAYLGPEDKRETLVKTHFESRSISSGTVNASFHGFLRLLESFCNDSELALVTYDHFSAPVGSLFGTEQVQRFLQPNNHPLLVEDAYDDFEEQTRRLDGTSLLGDASNFRTYGSFWYRVGQTIHQLDQDLRRRYVEHLEEKSSLGAALLIAISNDEPEDFASWLDTYHEEVPAIDPVELETLHQYFEDRSIYRNLEQLELSENAEAALNFLRNIKADSYREEIESLLAANRLNDLGSNYYDIDDQVQQYVRFLLPNERKRALKVFWKAVELVEYGRRTGQWNTSYGTETFASRTLGNIVNQSDSSEDTGTLNFFYDVLSTHSERASKAGEPVQSVQPYYLRNRFNRLVQAKRQEASGNPMTEADLFTATLPVIAARLDEDYWRYAAYPFFGYLDSLTGSNYNNMRSLISVVEAATGEGEHQELAAEILVCLKIRAAALAGEEAAEIELAAVIEKATAWLDDATIPLVVRLDIARALVENGENAIPIDLKLKALHLLPQAWDGHVAVRDDLMPLFMQSLLESEATDAWKAGMTAIIQPWKNHHLANPNFGSSSNDVTAAKEIVRLCAKLEDTENLRQIVNRVSRQPNVRFNGAWFATLIRSAPLDLVKSAISRNWTELDWRVNSGSQQDFVYDAEMESRLKQLLPLIEDQDLALLAQAFVASMPDPDQPNSEEDESSPRDQRLLTLAKKVETHEFSNPLISEAVLSFLAESKAASDSLAEAFEKAASDITPLTWTVSNNQLTQAQRQAKQRLFEAHLRNALRQGPELVLATIETIRNFNTRNSYYRSEAFMELLRIFEQVWKREAAEWPDGAREKNTAIWSSLLSSESYDVLFRSDYRQRDWMARAWIFDQLEGDGTAAAAWEQDEDRTESFRENSQFATAVLRQINNYFADVEYDVEARSSLALRFCQSPVITESLGQPGGDHRTLFSRFVSYNLLDDEELLTVGPDLVNAAPRDGHAAAELAGRQEKAGQEEAAIQSYDAALAALPESNTRDYSVFTILKAKLLAKTEGATAALAALDAMDQDRLDEPHRSGFDTLRFNYRMTAMLQRGEIDEVVRSALVFAESMNDGERASAMLTNQFDLIGRHLQEQEDHAKAAAYFRLAISAASLAGETSLERSRADLLASLKDSSISANLLKAPEIFIARGSVWKYLDDGSDQGRAWIEMAFDDSAWKEGPAELGYGDDDEATELSFGDDEANKHVTTYFRHAFTVPDGLSIANASLELLRDDGAAVYLDGREIARDNLPEGELAHDTFAPDTISGGAEDVYHRFDVSPEALGSGKHVIAVELHQRSGDSSDLSFDLALLANRPSDETIFTAMDSEAAEAAIGAEIWSLLPAAITEFETLPSEPGSTEETTEGATEKAPPAETSVPDKPAFEIQIQAIIP